jgi:uncharacterized Zn finger protein
MRRPSVSDWWRGNQPTKPIPVQDGIRARSKRGRIGETWWSQRFIEVLESLHLGGRLQRGKRYARAGQVMNLTLSTSLAVGLVQGSRTQPYRARIGVKAFSDQAWAALERDLAGQAWYTAKLLAGEMPTDIEDVFAAHGLSLFPTTMHELTMDCSCPDWEIPCKHLAATCYLLAESFDEDPFQILAWRGRGRDELLERLRELRGSAAPENTAPHAAPLEECLEDFWSAPQRPSAAGLPETDRAPAPVLDEIDPLPVEVGGVPAADLLRTAYEAFTRR